MSQTSDFINSLKEYNVNSLSKSIYIPSLEREVDFSTLTAKHKRLIIQSALDNPIFNAIFNQRVYDLIKELCSEPAIVDNLTTFDKDAILIQMRYHFVSKLYKGKDFAHVIEGIREIREDFTPKSDTSDNLIIEYTVPNIKDEKKLYSEYSNSKNYAIAPSDDDVVREMISDLYIIELCKYISIMRLTSSEHTMSFAQQTLQNKMDITDNIGEEALIKLQTYIEDLKKLHEPMYKIDEDTDIQVTSELFN